MIKLIESSPLLAMAFGAILGGTISALIHHFVAKTNKVPFAKATDKEMLEIFKKLDFKNEQ